jgi:Uma2 family endonuclease
VSTPEREVRLLTVAEYLALGETEFGYDELVEGRVFLSPSPGPDHNRALFRVAVQLEPQLPRELEVLLDLDVDLQLAPPDAPGFTRRPDVIVVQRPALDRVDRAGGELGYVDGGAVTGIFSTTEPFPVRLDLDALG